MLPELKGRMAGDISDYCDLLIRRANAARGTGLGGPEMDPSPSVSALRAPSLSQSPVAKGSGLGAPTHVPRNGDK